MPPDPLSGSRLWRSQILPHLCQKSGCGPGKVNFVLEDEKVGLPSPRNTVSTEIPKP